MSAIDWIKGGTLDKERVVGKNHATLADVSNRPLRQVMTVSGQDPDADFTGFIINSPQSLFAGTVQVPVRMSPTIPLAATGLVIGVQVAPQTAASGTFQTVVSFDVEPVVAVGMVIQHQQGMSINNTFTGTIDNTALNIQGFQGSATPWIRIAALNPVGVADPWKP